MRMSWKNNNNKNNNIKEFQESLNNISTKDLEKMIRDDCISSLLSGEDENKLIEQANTSYIKLLKLTTTNIKHAICFAVTNDKNMILSALNVDDEDELIATLQTLVYNLIKTKEDITDIADD